VGRPTWIGDGQDVAVLKRTAGHSENGYHIDVSRATSQRPNDQTEYTFPLCRIGQNIPRFPHIPRGKTGMWGMFQPLPAGMSINFGMS
jgi:hypothetical protein